MIVIQVVGGLGNQLQQYALYRKFVSMGIQAKLDISWFEMDNTYSLIKENKVTKRQLELCNFDGVDFEVCTKKEREDLIGSDSLMGKLRRKLLPNTIHWFKENQMYHPEILTFQNMYISGYFACEKYYADILCDLRESIRFPKSTDETINGMNQKMADQMNLCESVSIHIRRGDYLSSENAALFGNICTESYYKAAIEYLDQVCKSPHYYVFSDDILYVKEKYQGEKYTIVDINNELNSFYDIWLMSNCKHNICANSTFSFWGARLNKNKDKIMIRPTIHKNSQVYDKDLMASLWTEWIFFNPEGKLA